MSGRTGEAALRTLITKMGGWLSGFCRTWQSRDEVLCITVGQRDSRTAVWWSAVCSVAGSSRLYIYSGRLRSGESIKCTTNTTVAVEHSEYALDM